MKNFIQPGDTLTIPAPAAVASGGVVVAGGLVGIASTDAASGEPVAVALRGVFLLPKGAGAISLGATLHWDGAAVTTDADDGEDPPVAYPRIGRAAEGVGGSAGVIRVLLG